MSHRIETERLQLVTLGPAALRALLAGEAKRALALLGARGPASWPELEGVFRMRLEQLEAAPADEPWLLRAVVLRSAARVVGVTGFHGPPGGAWLQEYTRDGVEFGYTIFEGHRRRGYASEAGLGLMRWAAGEGVRSFVLSIGPENAASLRVADKLGFSEAGAWEHPSRGRELVYLRRLAPGMPT